MSAATEISPWASKAEASVQQARRFSQMREALPDELPPLPPLVRPNRRESTAPPLEQTLLSSSSTSLDRRVAPLHRPRANTAEVERQAGEVSAVPSVATLNRDFDRLSLAYAGMRAADDGAAAPSPLHGLPAAAATHHSGRTLRRTSVPVAQRPSLPQRSRPESGVGAVPVTTTAAITLEEDRRPSPAAPVLPPPRRTSLGVLEPPLPQVATPFRRQESNDLADKKHTEEQPAKTSLPFPPLEFSTAIEVDDALRIGPLDVAEPTSSPPASQQRLATAVAMCSPDVSAPATDIANRGAVAPVEAAEGAGGKDETNNVPPPPPRNQRKKNVTSFASAAAAAAEPKTTSPAPNGRGKGRDGRITVVVRKRPLASDEEGPDCVQVNGSHVRIAVTKQRVDLSSYKENSDYTFDLAYDATATNRDVYAGSVKDLLTVSLSGGSASCFAYGQTGSGKTYTMMGTDGESGLYLLAAGDLFGRLSAGQQLCICFYEIYCNSLFDLLNRRHPIVLREDANRRVNICGVVWRTVTAVDELWQLVKAGMEQRRTGSTSANEHSSRSHAVLSIRIKDAAHLDFTGVINFVDLAGSERAVDTAANDRLTRLEGAEINKSLLALKECIRALDEKRKHVPFRGSRLTEVLRDSFTGNSKTVMIATVSPSSHNHEHSNNTLRYAFRVKGLSIASVEPSKARNAPRPHVSVARSRSNTGMEDKSGLSSAPLRERKRKHRAEGDESGTASPVLPQQQQQQQQLRKQRHNRRRNCTSSSGNTDDDDAANASPAVGTAAATNELTDMLELSSIAELRARRASQQRRGSAARGSHAHASHDISDLLPSQHQSRDEPSFVLSSAPRQRSPRFIYEGPPANPLLLSDGERSSMTSNVNTPSLPPLNAAAVGDAVDSSPRAPLDIAAVERRLTQQIMAQLRQDLGRQLEDVLSEKDATISALRHENETLRKALDRAQREGNHSDGSSSPQETEGRRMDEPMPPTFSPPSPSILHEHSSSDASVSSPSDDTGYHVI
ncbi:Mitotic centromere-associated kinesin (MCAK) [Lotmaria passim]